MSRYVVDGVPVEDLHIVWDGAWPFLEKAIERFPNLPNKYTEGQLLRNIVRKEMQLWVGWDTQNGCVTGAIVTETIEHADHPNKFFLSIPLVGGENWNAWGDDIWNLIKAWGVAKGCTHALGYGRKGWCRWYGFVELGKTDAGVPMYVRTLKR